MESSRDQTIETLLVSVNRLIRTAAQAAGSPTSSAVWRTLGILETDQPLRLGELAAASRVAQPTMTRLVAGMLADGLISRTVDPDDSRGQLIELTEAGHVRLVQWRATLTRTVGPLFADLDDDAWDVLHDAATLIASRTSTRPDGPAVGTPAVGTPASSPTRGSITRPTPRTTPSTTPSTITGTEISA